MVKYAKNNQTLPRNGQNWSKYAKNSQKLTKIIKHLQTFAKCKIVEYCQNVNVRKLSKMHQFGKIVKYCQNIGNICQNVRKLSKIVKNW